MLTLKREEFIDKKIFILLFGIFLTIFIFTNDGHRNSPDEAFANILAKRIATNEPNPLWKEGKHPGFELGTTPGTIVCRSEYLCSAAYIGHGITQVPLFFVNHNLKIITSETLILTDDDFNDPHYVWWRNSLNPDFTFLELFYGPIFSSLSVGIFYLTCRTLHYSSKTSIIVTSIFGLTTSIWAYSQNSYNLIPAAFFNLLAVYLFIKYLKKNSLKSLALSGITIGVAFMTRQDAMLVGVILLVFLLISLIKQNKRKLRLVSFVAPASGVLLLERLIDFIRFLPQSIITGGSYVPSRVHPLYDGAAGLLFSPGVGIFIFYPILLTCFFSFVDFYKKNKLECFLFLSLITAFVSFYGTAGHWHGMSAYAARYLLIAIPFFLLPLGASLEKRRLRIFLPILIVLGAFGFLANLVYVIQDEGWFVWGIWGSEYGLISLGAGLAIHPVTLYTFEYSQLTHSIITAFTNLQLDIYLLKLFGLSVYLLILLGILIPLLFFIVRILHKNSRNKILNKHDKNILK